MAMAVILYSNAISFLFLCLALCLKKKQPEDHLQISFERRDSRSKVTRMTSGDLNMSVLVKSFGKMGEENDLDRRKQ